MKLKNYSLTQYLSALSKKEPTPGGGSASALAAATGMGLIIMVAEYSLGRKTNTKSVENRINSIIRQAKQIRDELIKYIDLDAEAYQEVVKARKGTKAQQNKADRYARSVSKNIAKLSYRGVGLAPYLIEKGNPHLIADVAVAGELLLAAYNGSLVLSEM